MLPQHAQAVVAVAKHDEVLTQQAGAHRLAVTLGNLLRQADGQPVPARELAHRRATFDPAKKLVLLLG